MSEFARYLLAAGITSSRFADIARIAFYRAASISGRFHNQKVNQSAVAAMTGLTRVQVRAFSQQERATARIRLDRIENVIAGWSADPAFTTTNYLPKRLSVGKKHATFNSLVRKYGGDVPARSILREMIRMECVAVRAGYVSLDPKAHRTLGQTRLRHLSQSLKKLLNDPAQQSHSKYPLRALNGEVTYPVTSAKGRILTQKRLASGLETLLVEVRSAGDAASVEAPPSRSQRDRITRTRVVIISEELDRKRLEKTGIPKGKSNGR